MAPTTGSPWLSASGFSPVFSPVFRAWNFIPSCTRGWRSDEARGRKYGVHGQELVTLVTQHSRSPNSRSVLVSAFAAHSSTSGLGSHASGHRPHLGTERPVKRGEDTLETLNPDAQTSGVVRRSVAFSPTWDHWNHLTRRKSSVRSFFAPSSKARSP